MTRRRKRSEAEQESLERWLITYADMITLLMAFFIMMYAMSVVDLQKFEALAGAMGTMFGGAAGQSPLGGKGSSEGSAVVEGGSGVLDGTTNADLIGSATVANLIQQRVKEHLSQKLREGVEVIHEGNVVTVRLRTTHVFFEVGRAGLTAGARRVLHEVGTVLSGLPYSLRVEGHTCDLPIRTYEYPSNWDLSAARATNVLLELVRPGLVPPGRISAVGFGATKPLVPNDSEEHRGRNRRVDILVMAGGPPEAGKQIADRWPDYPAVARGPGRSADREPSAGPQSLVLPVELCPPWNLLDGQMRVTTGAHD